MKTILPIIGSIIILIGISCNKKEIEAEFKDQKKSTILDYIVANQDSFSSFLSLLKAGGMDKILGAYNPYGSGYTLFLPDNSAVNKFIEESERFSSLDDLLNDTEYVISFCRYHIVNMAINANDFPFGALPEYTLTHDFLTVSFVIETDTSYYKINNQAPVAKTNIEVSNGFIHILGSALKPITFTTYQWLEENKGYSIFKSAVDITGLKATFDINMKDDVEYASPFTLFVEHDSVFNKRKIFTLDDLEKFVSPNNTDYTSPSNPLYNFVAYHALTQIKFLDKFVGVRTNFTTYSEIPLLIDGKTTNDICINKEKEILDTIITGLDTTIVDYIGLNYDASNILTQSGVIHFIDNVMTQQAPSVEFQSFEFWEESLFNNVYRVKAGEYMIEDSASLKTIKWKGANLSFIKTDDEESSAWNKDWLYINGDFTISYLIPKLVQGNYTVYLGANSFGPDNAFVQVFIDGKNIGGIVDLTTGGSSGRPFTGKTLGTINFAKYSQHLVEVKSLIPGSFSWDYISFVPKN